MMQRNYSSIIQAEENARKNRNKNLVLSAAAFAVTNIAVRGAVSVMQEKQRQAKVKADTQEIMSLFKHN